MRPQLILYRVVAVLLLFSSVALADQFASASNFGNKMRESLRSQDFSGPESSFSRLTSYVLELSYGDLLQVGDFRTQGFPEQQLACQRAITHGSISYVRKWIDATERGMTPEAANRFAGRQLQGVIDACNVPVMMNSAGTRIPSVGNPCSFTTSRALVDSKDLQGCLQQTLEFWASYLYMPANQ